MKAWRLHGVGDLRFEEERLPILGRDEALIKVKAAGICGSDVPRVFDTGAHRHPLVIGHEFSGIVESIGSEVNAAWLGRRVGIFPLIPCGECALCRKGQYEMCRNYDYLGSRRNGGFAEYVNVPAGNLIELPESVSFEEAAMLEPMAVAVHAIRKGTEDFGLSREAAVAVCGLGTIGLLTVMFLMEAGYRNIYAIGNKEFQEGRLLSIGMPRGHYCDGRKKEAVVWLCEEIGGVEVFFECTGRNEAFSWGVDSAKPEGRVVLVGNPYSDMTLKREVYWKLLRNQLTVTGTWNSSFTGDEMDDWRYVMKRLETHNVTPAELITHRLPLERLKEGLEIMRDRKEDYCKIMVSQEDERGT